ncbi:MAG: bifunctional 5,10-methylenetetrahydrofolate dehydrogenase/5,10-methenyltetrahydrofolate cyclohydrolase [Patescibacteria group bacterium]|nr:bifunctional 5,10-methylenetetrahydrofolate dehydrogenase/5,10-methenyltetrahydrofolate cyclohydrolase [Patescibacteria group bacterium]
MKIIDGKYLAEEIKNAIAQEVYSLGDDRPNLAIILVGHKPDSELYVKIKEREAKKVGIDTSLYRLEEDTTEEEVLSAINFLNKDQATHGILVQLPLPTHLDTDKIIAAINPEKDIDGFTPENKKNITNIDNPNRLLSPVILATLISLETAQIELKNSTCAIVAKDSVLTFGLKEILTAYGTEVSILDQNDNHLKAKTNLADILITAIGQPEFIKHEHIKPGATIIDIGISQNSAGKTVGDVDQAEAKEAAWLTPVPGGIGPLTVAFALQNTLYCYNHNKNIFSNNK